MAIFKSKHDREKIPMLSQLAQVDGENAAELDAVNLLFNEGRSTSPHVLPNICMVVQQTLYSLAASEGIPAGCLKWLNDHAATTIFHFQVKGDIPHGGRIDKADWNDSEHIEMETLEFLPWRSVLEVPGDQALESDIFLELCVYVDLSDLIRACMRRSDAPYESVRFCSECNHPFVVVTPSQLFCSHRCAHRSGTRRRRAQGKIPQEKTL